MDQIKLGTLILDELDDIPIYSEIISFTELFNDKDLQSLVELYLNHVGINEFLKYVGQAEMYLNGDSEAFAELETCDLYDVLIPYIDKKLERLGYTKDEDGYWDTHESTEEMSIQQYGNINVIKNYIALDNVILEINSLEDILNIQTNKSDIIHSFSNENIIIDNLLQRYLNLRLDSLVSDLKCMFERTGNNILVLNELMEISTVVYDWIELEDLFISNCQTDEEALIEFFLYRGFIEKDIVKYTDVIKLACEKYYVQATKIKSGYVIHDNNGI